MKSKVISGQPSLKDNSCNCGRRRSNLFDEHFATRIVGGGEAEVNEFPWAALLIIQGQTSKPVRCGGTLINDRCVALDRETKSYP